MKWWLAHNSIMLPVNISPQLLEPFDKIIQHILWNRNRPRINKRKMCEARDIGGLDFPNGRLYNLAFEMSWLSA